jgi:Uma2 family endonuclease
MPLPKQNTFTLEDIYALPDGERAELIDGELYMMAPPNFIHQKLVHQFDKHIGNYVDEQGGSCEVIPAPFAVFLDKDDKTYVEPDISVICDKKKLDEKGCHGAPDWIVEIVSPATQRMDYGVKLFKYRTAGVREYWIVNPLKKTVQTYVFGEEEYSEQFSFDEDIPVRIYDGLFLNVENFLK